MTKIIFLVVYFMKMVNFHTFFEQILKSFKNHIYRNDNIQQLNGTIGQLIFAVCLIKMNGKSPVEKLH